MEVGRYRAEAMLILFGHRLSKKKKSPKRHVTRARIYRPSFRENKPKTLVFSHCNCLYFKLEINVKHIYFGFLIHLKKKYVRWEENNKGDVPRVMGFEGSFFMAI